MNRTIFMVIIGIVLMAAAGCSSPQEAPPPSGQTAEAATVAENTEPELPALDNTMSYSDFPFRISFPSAWGFSSAYDEINDTNSLLVDCGNDNVLMWIQEAWLPGFSESDARDFYENNPLDWKSFRFGDGTEGYYCVNKPDDALSNDIVFAYVTGSGVYLYSTNCYSDAEWYSDNEVLIFEVAKTLSANKPSTGYFTPESPEKASLPDSAEITVVWGGVPAKFTGALAYNAETGIALYLLPDFQIDDEYGVTYVYPHPESGITPDMKMIIYRTVDTGIPVPEPYEDYPTASEFRRTIVGGGSFDIQFIYPIGTAVDDIAMLYGMADTICTAE